MELVDTGTVRLAVERWGTGYPVVLVAGIGAGREMWTPALIESLVDASFEVIAFNNRGVAPSSIPAPPYTIDDMAADAAALIGTMQLGTAAVVGFSLGALIAQELALARPDVVRAAVLIGSMGRKDLLRRRLGEHAAREVSTLGATTMSAAVRALQLFGPDRLDDDAWIGRYLAIANETSGDAHDGLVGQQSASTAYDDRLEALAHINVPCLVLSFELDLLTPATLGRELAAAIPGARYVETPRCGHGGLWERPDETAKTIVEFLTVAIEKQR